MDKIPLQQPILSQVQRDSNNFSGVFSHREKQIGALQGMPGRDSNKVVPPFLNRWRAYPISLGTIPQDQVRKACDLSGINANIRNPNPRSIHWGSINAYIHGAIVSVSKNPINTRDLGTGSPKAAIGSENDPDASQPCMEVQENAVRLLMSSVAWNNNGKMENNIDFNWGKTTVQWPMSLGIPPGVQVSPETPKTSGTSPAYIVECRTIASWLTALYRTQGPGAMYAAIQFIQFDKPVFDGAFATVRDPLAVQGTPATSKYLHVCRDPRTSSEQTAYLRTMGDVGRVALARFVLQGIGEGPRPGEWN